MSRNQPLITSHDGFQVAEGTLKIVYRKNYPPDTVKFNYLYGDKLLYSEGHRGPPYRSGGPFAVVHCSTDLPNTGLRTYCWVGYRYERCIVPRWASDSINGFMWTNWTSSLMGSANTLKAVQNYGAYGPGAIKRFRPDTPIFAFGQFVAELRDIPRLPWEIWEKANFFKNLGSQYLNVQFGWVPFLKDLRDLLNWQATMDKRVRQLIRDNRKVVRRRGSVDEKYDHTTTSAVFDQAGAGGYTLGWSVTSDAPRGTFSQTSTYKRNIWFSGAFQYFIEGLDGPGADAAKRMSQLRRALSGLSLTPSLLYELTPWSWLLDWFTNVGDVISNASSSVADRHVMRYGYLMCHETWSTETTVDGELPVNDFLGWKNNGQAKFANSRWEPFNARMVRTVERKSRIAANPYSFGVLDWNGLSAFQTSILVALGLSAK